MDGTINLPHSLRCGNSADDLFRHICPDLNQQQDDSYFVECAILTSHNVEVQDLNKLLLNKFPGDLKTYDAADSILHEEGVSADGDVPQMYQPEYLASLTASGLPLSELQMKLGVPMMLLHNLDPANGLCNGTQGVFINISQCMIEI